MIVKSGATRTVFITRRFAYKIPYIYKYRNFLCGLLSNMQEVEFDKLRDPRLCPVLFSLPFGLLVVMPKVANITEFDEEQLKQFCEGPEYMLPVEIKQDSFGYYNGKLVAIDYGS